MKKSLLAVAVAAALPAAAFAQSSVTLYGIVDLGLTRTDNGVASNIKVDSGMLSSSRFGLRGAEDLGGGLKAIFNIEGGMNNDDGSGKAGGGLDFTRRSVVGLNGGFGEVRLGRDYTPAFLMAGSWDPLGYGHYGNMLNYTVGSNGAGLGGTSVRFSNAIFYDSPSFGGFKIGAAYRFGEVAGASDNGRGFSVSGGYAAGPINVGAYYENSNQTAATVPGTFFAPGTLAVKKFGVGGGYDFGAFGVKASYQKTDPDGANNAVKFFNVGGNVVLGAGQLLLSYSQATPEAWTGKVKTFGIAYDYPLSKRTMTYISYGQVSNSGNAQGNLFSSDTAVVTAGAGLNAKAFVLGVRHSF